MSEAIDRQEAELETTTEIVIAPTVDAMEHTASAEVWAALTTEIEYVVKRIQRGDELTPTDVTKVRQLKSQVEQYLTTFNKAVKAAQADYKQRLTAQLLKLNYNIIDDYITVQKKKQSEEQTARMTKKQMELQRLVEEVLEGTTALKATVLATELLPAFTHRFPNVNSGAKDKDIKEWGPYKSVIQTSLHMLDVFFMDESFKGADLLPVTAATMQQLLAYVRTGDLALLAVMRDIFAKDAEYLIMHELKAAITTKEIAVDRIKQAAEEPEKPVDEKLTNIARILRIAETLI